MSTTQLTAYCDATLLTGEATVENHALLIENGTIRDIVGMNHIPTEARRVSCNGAILAPGLIDVQVNGGANLLLNNEPTMQTCLTIAKAHRERGTSALLLTCISDTKETTERALKAVREARKADPGILGIHFEGPHLDMERRGVHSAAALRPLSPEDRSLYKRDDGEVMLITLAPEKVLSTDIQTLHKDGIIISMGHTKAQPEMVLAALKAGASGFTHLYNGMGGLSARNPGVLGIALDDRNSWCSLITDGHHVAPEMIRLALRSKPTGKIILVSDAMPPAATEKQQSFRLYGKSINVSEGRCTNSDGALAGSAITLLDAVRYCVQNVGVELDEALRMASTYPAAFLGLGKTHGKLLPGFKANMVALDSQITLRPLPV